MELDWDIPSWIERIQMSSNPMTVDDLEPGETAWIARYEHDENNFPSCELLLIMRTTKGVVFLEDGDYTASKYSKDWKALPVRTKVVVY